MLERPGEVGSQSQTKTSKIQDPEKTIFSSTAVQEADGCGEASTSIFLTEDDGAAACLDSESTRRSKLQKKRLRNRTIDYHDLYPSPDWAYNGKVAQYVQTTYLPETSGGLAKNPEDSSCSAFEAGADSAAGANEGEGLGQGLGIILDKLRSIETKLDEIKTMEQNVWYPEVEHGEAKPFPEVGVTPSVTPAASTSVMPRNVSNKSLPIEHCVGDEPGSSVSCGSSSRALTTTADNIDEDDTDDDTTLAADDKLSITEHVEEQEKKSVEPELDPKPKQQTEDFLITSPSPTFVTISEIKSPQIILTTDDEDDADDDEPEDEAAQQRRIEELSRRIMVEKERLEQLEKVKREAMAAEEKGLDTLSERSEDEEEKSDRRKLRRSSVSNERKKKDFFSIPLSLNSLQITSSSKSGGSGRSRRTRSASRDRSLVKIKFCWRCHQTGHESFDCSAEMNPGNWCPRCLESNHWEDNCWIDSKQV